jgi:hypothetical protein
LIVETEPQLATEVSQRIDQCLENANALQPPFDREIAADNEAGRQRVFELIAQLGSLEDALSDVFAELGFELPQQTEAERN